MAISLSTIRKSKAATAPIVMIYGVAKVGKTSLAAEAPSPIFLQMQGEKPPAGVETDAWDINSFEDVLGAIGTLFNEEHEFKTIVFDSIDALEGVVWAETCRRNGWGTIEDAGFGKGYVAAVAVWKEVIDGFMTLRAEKGMNVILLGHTEINRFDSPTTDPYSRYRVNLHKRSADLIEAACDVIGFVNYRVSLKKVEAGFNKSVTHGEGGGARVIHVEERPGFIAGNRYNMPPEINYKKGEGWSSLAKFFPPAE